MSTLSPEEQELFDTAKVALPRFFFQKDNAPQETLGAAAKTFQLAKTTIAGWLAQSYILQATGFWLDQHAIDRGTRRQNGETDAALAARIRQVEDAVTVPALRAAVNAVLTTAGLANCTIVENHSAHAFLHASGAVNESFWGRGQRWGGGPQLPGSGSRQIIVILPYATPSGIVKAIKDALTRKKGAGFAPVVEVPGVAYRPRGSVTPPAAKLQVNVGATQQFTSQFFGLPATHGAASWAVDGIVGGNATVGTIDGTGLYAAPTAVPNGNGYDHEVTCTIAYSGGTVVGRARMQLFNLTAIPLHTEVLGDSPWLYWRLGAPAYSGTTALDASGNGRTGTLNGFYTLYNAPGGPTLNAPDNQGFTQLTNGWVASTLTPPTGAGFSCEFWFSGQFATDGKVGDTGGNFAILWSHATGNWSVTWGASGFASGTIGTTAYNSGGHHVAFTWDGTTGNFYLDGALKGSAAMAAPAALANFGIDPAHSSSFEGNWCELAVYASALSATQVLNHYKAGTGTLFS